MVILLLPGGRFLCMIESPSQQEQVCNEKKQSLITPTQHCPILKHARE